MNSESSRNIGLIGFMGCGKSIVGKALATELHYQFIDTDSIIEERIGKTISDLFMEEGEEFFRNLEGEIIEEVCKSESSVISFGGGAVLSSINVRTIRKSSTIILLSASIDSIKSRIKSSSHRPLLHANDGNLKDKIESLLARREDYYTKAMDFKIVTDGKNVNEIVNEIIRRLQL